MSKTKDIIRRILAAFFSNAVGFLVSCLVILIVPKFVATEQYGYFQLYIFYTGYIGFINLGWPEGLLLRFGGQNYNTLDKKGLKIQYELFSTFSGGMGIIICIIAFLTSNGDKTFVWLGVGFCIIIHLPRAFLQVLLHMTNRTVEYARGILIEKVVYFISVAAVILSGLRSFHWLIISEILARLIASVYIMWTCSDILHAQRVSWRTQVPEICENIRVGIQLMFANLIGLFLIGVVRQSIEWRWDIETFGKVSFTLSISNLLMILIRSIAIVFFPVLKTISAHNLAPVYKTLRIGLITLLFAMLAAYFPAAKILSTWLPQYEQSLHYMALLFPMCIFECRMSLLIESYMKALRMERKLLLVNLASVIVGIGLSGLTVFIWGNLELAVLSILVLVGLRCIGAELLLAPRLNLNYRLDTIVELLMIAGFIYSSWFVGGLRGSVIYVVIFMGYLVLERKDIKSCIEKIKCLKTY